MDAVIVEAMALGENAEVDTASYDLDRLADFPAAGLAVDYDVTAVLHRIADHRDFQQFFFGDETGLARHER